MEKLKKVFSPGNDKDDEMMYGSPAARKANAETGAVGQGQASTSPTTTQPYDGKDHGIKRQILNPDGNKYEEQKFGTAPSGDQATTSPSTTAAHDGKDHLPREQESALESRMGEPKEDRSVQRKVLDPSSSGKDESGYAASGFAGSHTAANPTDVSHGSSTRPEYSTPGSALSMKSGVLGSPDQSTEERALHKDGITHPEQSSNLGRNAALAGAGAAVGAGGAYAATRPDDSVNDSTHTDRSFPLSGGAVAPQHASDPVSSTRSTESSGLASASGNTTHISGLNTGTAGGTGASSGDDARAQLGLARHSGLEHAGHSHSFHGDPCEGTTAEKTLGHVPGPHATVAANMLDPHVPGEFPTDDGLDPHSTRGTHGATGLSGATQPTGSSSDHHYGRDAALVGGAGAAGLGAHEVLKDKSTTTQQPSTSPYTASGAGAGAGYPAPLGSHEALADRTLPTQQPAYSSTTQPGITSGSQPATSSTEHHHGRDAAIAGGAGAAGLGAYAATRDHHEPSNLQQHQNTSTVDTSLSHTGTSQPLTQTQSPQHVPGNPLTGAKEPQSEHHYGRDAALVGGAGAAGYGANEYLRDRNTTEPASTAATAPHAQPAIVGHNTTTSSTAPHNPAVLDKTDPRNQSEFNRAQQEPLAQKKEHHYGRDAALVGGAGAAGAAGYSALHDDREDTGPASKTIGPHKSNIANIVDPRVKPEPEKMKDHTTAGPWQSDTLNKVDPKVTSDPNKADVKAHGYASGVAPQQHPVSQDKEHHYGRDAALAGGAGAAGYGASQAYDKHQQPNQPQQQQSVSQEKEHHYGRDAALAGGAGAAGYGATQAYDKHEQEKLAKEQAKEQDKLAKEHEKQAQHDAKERAKEQEKQIKHEQKEADKKAKHDAHEAEKAHKKEEKEHAKEQEKLEKQHAKEQEKLEKQHSKEQEKIEKHQAKEAEKAEKERLKEQEKLEKEKEKEDAKLAAARHDEAEAKHKEHNKLHKTPPEEREKGGIFHRIFHNKHYEREGADGARKSGSFEESERSHGLGEGSSAATAGGVAGAGALGHEGGPSSTTARAAGGESALGKSSFEQPGLGGEGDGMVTDQTTGLPMNVGKYGYGTGGTDANEAIAGHYKQ